MSCDSILYAGNPYASTPYKFVLSNFWQMDALVGVDCMSIRLWNDMSIAQANCFDN